MTPAYALRGNNTGQLLTYGGRVIVHHDRDQLEFLCPGAQVVPVDGIPMDQCLPIRFHPQFESVQWGPAGELDRRQFRDARH